MGSESKTKPSDVGREPGLSLVIYARVVVGVDDVHDRGTRHSGRAPSSPKSWAIFLMASFRRSRSRESKACHRLTCPFPAAALNGNFNFLVVRFPSVITLAGFWQDAAVSI
jgi:hypothetical protein